MSIEEKLDRLRSILRGYGSCLVAYSGGVDSVLLAKVAFDVLGPRALAAIADSPSLPRRELQEAVEIAERYGIPLRVVRTAEFSDPNYLANPTNRCYFCKQALFTELRPIAQSEGFAVIAYGENASDLGDHRPGAQAAHEAAVRAPLREAELTKADIRQLSALMGLPTAEKPQLACLSSRVASGEAVTPEKLAMIEESENFIRDLGFRDVRVRHHELGQGALARIELGAAEPLRVFQEQLQQRIVDRLREIGYAMVALDLAGYRRGSTNGIAAPIQFRGGQASVPPG